MATPRKNWFRCADSVLREPWSRNQKLTLVLLQAHLNTRWRRDGIPHEEAGRCWLSSGDVENITGYKRIRSGFLALAKLSGSVSLAVRLENDFVFVDWPKFPEYQEYGTRLPGSSRAPERAPPVSDSVSISEDQVHPATPSQGTNSPEGNSEKTKTQARGNPPPARHPEALRLAELLCNELIANVKHWTPPGSLEGWTTEFDRMLRLDGPHRSGIPPNDIERVIRWVVRDEFERANVQSAGKLRKRFAQLAAKANGARASPRPTKLERIAQAVRKSEEREHERQRQRETQDSGDAVRALPEG